MRSNRWIPGDDAVSPVIGVVLLVGIAVTLMASIGVFVLGFGPGEQTPRGEVQFAQEGGNVTITVADGTGLFADEVSVQVDSEEPCLEEGGWSGSLEPGDELTVFDPDSSNGCGNDDFEEEQIVRVVWDAGSGGRSEIIGEYEYF